MVEIIDLAETLGKLGKEPARRADQRWGKPVMARGYTILPAMLIKAQHRLGLSSEHFNVIIQLAYHWWDAHEDPHPSKALLAERMDRSPKQVQRYLGELERAGLLKRIKRVQANKGQTNNGYDLSGLVAKLQTIAEEDAAVAEENAKRSRAVTKRGARKVG